MKLPKIGKNNIYSKFPLKKFSSPFPKDQILCRTNNFLVLIFLEGLGSFAKELAPHNKEVFHLHRHTLVAADLLHIVSLLS